MSFGLAPLRGLLWEMLLRRERSDYNFGNFTAYLPRTLAALRDLLQQRAGIALAPRVLR